MENSEHLSPPQEPVSPEGANPEAVVTESAAATSSQVEVPAKPIDQVIGQEPVSPEGANPEATVTESAAATSSQVEVPAKLIDQVIGQEHAVEVIRKAAIQRRHVMMIGSPGTGKSMLAKAMAELLPKEDLLDILVYPNSDDPNNPVVRTVAAGRGKQIVTAHKAEAKKKIQFRQTLLMLLLLGIAGYAIITMQLLMGLIAGAFVFMALRYTTPREETMVPKLLVSNDTKSIAPFIDGTGSMPVPCLEMSATTRSRAGVWRPRHTTGSNPVQSTVQTGASCLSMKLIRSTPTPSRTSSRPSRKGNSRLPARANGRAVPWCGPNRYPASL